MASITLEELHIYHSIDRDIFSRLVVLLRRDPAESLLVMAVWLWLEEKGFPNVVEKMIKLPDGVVNNVANEAVLCFKSLYPHAPPLIQINKNLPFTSSVMEKTISLEYFYQNKFSAITGIKSFLNTVCSRIFTDILESVLGLGSNPNNVTTLVIPGFPHPVFGDVTITPKPLDFDFPTGGLWGWDPSVSACEDDRTMFLTFSRGFPVTENEVTSLFNRLHGNCVVSIQMQENVTSTNKEQPLFARMIVDSVGTVDKVLSGKRIAKFRINGKHIWARKYERRDSSF